MCIVSALRPVSSDKIVELKNNFVSYMQYAGLGMPESVELRSTINYLDPNNCSELLTHDINSETTFTCSTARV
jgi:hypothetical protein